MTESGYLYKCSAGETFDGIANLIYGNEKYACDLMNANPQYITRIVFDGSERLILPLIDETNDAEEQYAPSNAPWKE